MSLRFAIALQNHNNSQCSARCNQIVTIRKEMFPMQSQIQPIAEQLSTEIKKAEKELDDLKSMLKDKRTLIREWKSALKSLNGKKTVMRTATSKVTKTNNQTEGQ
jgi:hypothetical protein